MASFRASSASAPTPGTSCSAIRGRRSSTRFAEIVADSRHSVSTPGDLLFHIRAERIDSASSSRSRSSRGWTAPSRPWMRCTASATSTTETSQALSTAPRIRSDREAVMPRHRRRRYRVFPGELRGRAEYVHDLATWDALKTEEQEAIIGRTKLADIELADDVKPSNAHSALTVIVEDGEEIDILRHNMPFGDASGVSGTYFIGYARSPRVLEQMLENMFVGVPPGNYDRLLDFTHPVTGTLFSFPRPRSSRRSSLAPRFRERDRTPHSRVDFRRIYGLPYAAARGWPRSSGHEQLDLILGSPDPARDTRARDARVAPDTRPPRSRPDPPRTAGVARTSARYAPRGSPTRLTAGRSRAQAVS